MVDELKRKGSDCPFMKDLREHIIKYKLYEAKAVKIWKEDHWEDIPQDSTIHKD